MRFGARTSLLTRLLGLATLLLATVAHAQTAQFSYAIQTLGGGFYTPTSVAVDSSGTIYIADHGGIEKMSSTCTSSSCVTTLGGGFVYPNGVAVDSTGNVYVADTFNNEVKKMASTCTSSSCVTTLGGGFNAPDGVAVDPIGNVYVADSGNNAVKKMQSTCTSSSCVLTLGGGFTNPQSIVLDSNDNIYVADQGHSTIGKLVASCFSSSCVTTLGGGFNDPSGLTLDASGNLYIADNGNSAIKKMASTCTSSSCVTTLSGSFKYPQGVAVDSSGNVYVADSGNGVVKGLLTTAVSLSTTAIGQSSSQTLYFTFTASGTIKAPAVLTLGAPSLDFTDAGTGTCTTNGSSHTYNAGDTCTVNVNFNPKYPGLRQGAVQLLNSSGTVIATALVYGTGTGPQAVFNAPLTPSSIGGGFHNPARLAVDGSGGVYVADVLNNAVKEVPSGCTTSSCVISLGGGFSLPQAVAHDGGYNVYVADAGNSAVKEIPSGCTSSSCVLALGGGFSSPDGVSVDGSGNVYVADTLNNAVKDIPVGCTSSSCVLTLGGGFSSPNGVAVDASGNVYVADEGNNVVKEVPSGCTSSGCVTTLGGGFSAPRSVAVDAAGDVYVADSNNNAIKEIPTGCAASSCVVTLTSGVGNVVGVALDAGGNVYFSENLNNAVEKLDRFDSPSFTFATSTTIGTTDTTDGTQTATLANIGNQALSFPVPASGRTNPSFPNGFLYDSGSTCTELTSSSASAATLAAGASCTLGIDFQPALAGTSNDYVVLKDTSLNGAYASQSIAVSGTGLKQTPTVTVSPAVSYYGTTSVTLSATVAYTGTSAPTGAFTFQVGSGTAFAATCTGAGSPLTCTASYSTGSLPAGSYTVTGSLATDSIYNSASNTATLTVTANASNPETESVLWNFVSSSGQQSESSLIQASDGNFYGTAYNGGTCTPLGQSGCGTVFQITPSGTYTVIHTFTGSDGCNPLGSLVQGTDGNLYGTTGGAGSAPCPAYGTVFKISIVPPYTFTLLHTFSGSDGLSPYAGLVQGNDGNLYGTTSIGGANGLGTVFKISPASPYTLTVLHTFAGGTNDGQQPYGALVQGTDGNFYGTTTYGGSTSNPALNDPGDGTVFKISPVSPYTFTLLHSFYIHSGSSDGGTPFAGLVQGTDGNFYGTTPYGGANSAGIAFKISPTSPYPETVLHAFANASTDGDAPYYGALFEGSDGNFYGTTKSAGANGVGLAYSLSPSSPYTLSLLHSFASATTDGNTPYGGLAQGADGNFYGTTTAGGTNGLGVVYKLTPTSTLAAPVSLSAPASVSAGANFTLSYAVLNAPPAGAAVGTLQQCFATNTAGDTTGWIGVLTGYATASTANLTAPSTAGIYTYTLTCGGTESSSVTLTVLGTATFGTMSFSPAATEPQGTSQTINISDTLTYNGAQPTGAVTFTLNGVGYTATCTGTGSPETCSATVPAATIAALGVNAYTVTAALASDSIYASATGTSGTFTITAPLSGYIWVVNAPGTLDKVNDSGTAALGGAVGTSGTTSTLGGVAFDSAGNVWSVTNANNTLNFVTKSGTGATTYTGGGLNAPTSIAVDGAGYIWVANSGNNSVSEFNNSGTAKSGTTGLGSGAIGAGPSGIAIDSSGGVWVTSKTGNSVTHIIGAATPATAPLSTATTNKTQGTEP